MRLAASLLALVLPALAWAGPDQDLIAAAKQSDVAAAEKALAAGASPNATDTDGHAVLEKAIFSPELTKLLLSKGADPNGGSYPALVSASNNYAVDTMKLLLDAGADPNRPGVFSDDPGAPIRAMIAAEEAKGKGANKLMLQAYRTALSQAKPGTPLSFLPLRQVVAQTNCVPCLDLLLERGADPKLVTEGGGNLLHLFAAYGMDQAARKGQFEKGAEVVESRYGVKVPAWYRDVDQVGNGTPAQMMARLAKLGLDLEAKNAVGNTPLHEVLAGGVGNKAEVGVALVKAGADVNAVHDKFGHALLVAARTKMVDVVKAMVEAGADVNTEGRGWDENAGQFAQGFTPLVIAAMQDDVAMARYLVSAGAKSIGGVHGSSYSIKSGCHQAVRGKGALYYAIENGNAELVDLLAPIGTWSPFTIDQLRTATTSQQGNVEVTTIRCLADGTYGPSAYAAAIGRADLASKLGNLGL